MGRILTRQEWNDLVGSISNLAESPPNGCTPAPTLDEVPEGHRWSVADIQAARDTLMAICGENVFSAPLTKWTEEIIDELYDAYFRGWCGCQETPCNDPVTYGMGPFAVSNVTQWWIGVLALAYVWNDDNQNGQIDSGEVVETCYASERWTREGYIHPYPALDGYQVYADFYVPVWNASQMQHVRTWELRRIYSPYTDDGICPSAPVTLPARGICGGELQPDGSIQLWGGDPEVPCGIFAIIDSTFHEWRDWPGGYQLRGNCFSIGLDNFTIAHGLPGNTLVGHVICSDPHYNVNLLGHPNLYQVGTEIRTRRTFSEYEYDYELIFTLRATGDGTYIYGPYDRSFKLIVT